MLYICLSNYSFIRCTPQRAYIANQSTGKQLVYDSAGGDWLKMLTHHPQSIEKIINLLAQSYEDVNIAVLSNDFEEFIKTLVDEGFVVAGTTLGEIGNRNKETIQKHIDIPPITDLTLEITNCCNERCVHCYLPNKLKDEGSFISIDKAKSLVDAFVEMGGQTVTLTGGEVFLYKDLSRLLNHIYQKGLKITIYSNLIALTEKRLKELEELNVASIQVSLYGVHPDVHDLITGVKGSCVRTKRSIEKIVGTHIPLKIVCPVMRENSMDIIDVLRYGKEHAVPVELELNITARENHDTDNLEHRLSVREMESLLHDLMAYDKEYTISLLHRHKYQYDEHFAFAEYLNYPVCTAGHYGLYITADGKVTTCPNLQGIEMAHINQSSLKNIWNNNQKINELRTITECSFKQCINCVASDYCFRCFARNYTETGDYMEMPQYACDMAFLAKKVIEEHNNQLPC